MSILEKIALTKKQKRNLIKGALVIFATAATMALTYFFLAPKGAWVGEPKFMHCKECFAEQPYDERTIDSKCRNCPKKDGTLVATAESIKKGAFNTPKTEGSSHPWKWFNVAMIFESVLFLGLLVVVFRPRSTEEKEIFFYCNCPYCKWRLKFRESSAGKGGQCPRCKRLFRFPEESEPAKDELVQEPETQEQIES